MIKILKQTNQPEITTMPKVDLSTMNGQQLLDLYNSLATAAGKPTRKAKFQSKEEAIERVKALASAAKPAEETVKTVPLEKPKVAAKATEKPARASKAPIKDTKEAAVIRILSDGNPRREGSDAHKYFEAMMGGVTVEKYMASFPQDKDERKKAKQWLWNTKRDGHIELLG
jgi:hypothetical protein